MQHDLGSLVYNVQVEPTTQKGQLVKRVIGGTYAYIKRTSVNDRIDGYVSDVYTHQGVKMATVAVGNCIAKRKGGLAPEIVIYEDTTNPAEVTNTPGGKRVGVVMGGGVYGGGDDVLIAIEQYDIGFFDYISTPALQNGNGTWQVYDNTLPSFTLKRKSIVVVSYFIEINKSGFATPGINASGVYFNPANSANPEARFDVVASYNSAVVPNFANEAWDYVKTTTITLEAGTYTPGVSWYLTGAGNYIQASPHQRVNIAWF